MACKMTQEDYREETAIGEELEPNLLEGIDDPSSPAPGKKRRRVQGGVTSNDVVHSAYVADNAEVFAAVAGLHLPEGALVADPTYGKGVFWKNVPHGRYRLEGLHHRRRRGRLAGGLSRGGAAAQGRGAEAGRRPVAALDC